MGRRPVRDVLRRIPFLVTGAVFPKGAAEIVVWEEELFRGDLVECAKDAVVGYECAEFAAQGVALDPLGKEGQLSMDVWGCGNEIGDGDVEWEVRVG